MTTDASPQERCAVHPSRPSVDRCPVCDRPRCTADVGQEPGCAACGGSASAVPKRPPVTPRAVIGAAVACSLAWPVAAAITSQYVEVRIFSVVVPLCVGVGSGFAAEAGARGARGWWIRWVAVFYAVVATAYGFVFEPAGVEPLDLEVSWLPYVAAAAGAYAWTAPPKKKRAPAGSAAASRRRSRRTGA